MYQALQNHQDDRLQKLIYLKFNIKRMLEFNIEMNEPKTSTSFSNDLNDA